MRTSENSTAIDRGPGPRSKSDEFSEVRMAVQYVRSDFVFETAERVLHLMGSGLCRETDRWTPRLLSICQLLNE